jgi:hypothetical protein
MFLCSPGILGLVGPLVLFAHGVGIRQPQYVTVTTIESE